MIFLPTERQILERAAEWRNRKIFALFPIKCDDGKWRWFDTLRVQECRVGRGWYRMGAQPVLWS